MRGHRELGMTLVEMLAVLAIIAVTAGATVLGFGAARRGASAESEARTFAARLQLAADETMVTDRPLALSWQRDGYAFLEQDAAGRWRAGSGAALAPRALPDGVTLAAGPGRGPLRVSGDGGGAAIAARFAKGGERWAVDYDGIVVTVAPIAAGAS